MIYLVVILVGLLLFNRFFGMKGKKFDLYFGVIKKETKRETTAATPPIINNNFHHLRIFTIKFVVFSTLFTSMLLYFAITILTLKKIN